MTQEEWTEVFAIQRYKITIHVILHSLLHVVKVGLSTKVSSTFQVCKRS